MKLFKGSGLRKMGVKNPVECSVKKKFIQQDL